MRVRPVLPALAACVLAVTVLAPSAAGPPPASAATGVVAEAGAEDAAMLDLQARSVRSASRLQDALSTTVMVGGLFGLFAAGTLVIGAVDPRLRARRRSR